MTRLCAAPRPLFASPWLFASLSPFITLLLAVAALGCAHQPAREGPIAGDDRAVLIEFWADWCGPCHTFEREYLPEPEMQRALRGVRFVRYDVDSSSGSATYQRLTGSSQKRVPMFVAMLGDRVVLQRAGLPRDHAALVHLVDDVAALGGSEASLRAALATRPGEPSLLMRMARWLEARQRHKEAADYYAQVTADQDTADTLRAEAEWQRGRLLRRGLPRDPHALVDFALAYPGTPYGHAALEMLAVLRDVSPDDTARALRAAYDRVLGDGPSVNDLVYHALAAHQYDLALQLAQQAVKLLKSASAWDTLAEVYYYRQDSATAIGLAQRATALDPQSASLRENLARFRRADGTPCRAVEDLRYNGLFLLPRFYGDAD